jgi:putative membrane protein
MELNFNEQTDNNTSDHQQEIVKAVVLVGLTIYFIYNIISGNLANYINDRFVWLSYVAVLLFGILSAVTVAGLLRGDYNNRTSDHTSIGMMTIFIMALPLILGTLVPSQPLGADAVRGNVALRAATFDVATVASKDPLDRTVLDWVNLFAQPNISASEYDGQVADFVGFVLTEPGFPDDHVMVVRNIVSCCVADLSGIGVPVYWPQAATLQDDQWVRITGTFEAGVFRDTKTPILQAEAVEMVEQPEHPYLYP